MEIWKKIPGSKSLEISTLGRIRNWKNGEFRNPAKNTRGYYQVSNGIRILTVHSIMAEVFLDHKRDGMKMVVDHINGDITDNRLENLRIVTQQENVASGYAKKYPNRKYRCIYQTKNKKSWYYHSVRNGTKVYKTGFNSEEEAAQAYQEALTKIEAS